MIRAGAAYLVAAWLVLEVGSVILPAFGAPPWMLRALIYLLGLGFLVTLILSWAFELTPEGLMRESEIPVAERDGRYGARKLNILVVALILIALGVFGIDRLGVFLPAEQEGVAAGTQVERWTELQRRADVTREEPLLPEVDLDAIDPTSIAVLPFLNLSASPDDAYFADGMAEEILLTLARTPGLRVAARTSSFQFRDPELDVAYIAGELKVAHVLEGSVRRSGNRVRVSAQLIEADSGFTLWTDTFTREMTDVFALQDDVAAAIADEMKVQLGISNAERHGSVDPRAYELYLQGMALWHERDYEGLLEAERLFQQAVELEPGFAKAYEGLALTYAIIGGYGPYPGDTNELAVIHAERAETWGGETEATLTARGSAVTMSDPEAATEHYRRAIQLNPNFATALQWYGSLLAQTARMDEGIYYLERAVAIDPRSRIVGTNLADVLFASADADAALREAERVLAFSPDWYDARTTAAYASRVLGDFDEFERHLLDVGRDKGLDAYRFVERIVAAIAVGDDRAAVVDELASVPLESQHDPEHPNPFQPADVVRLLMILRAQEHALTWVERLVAEAPGRINYWLALSPEFAPIACEPSFQEALARIQRVYSPALLVCD